MTIEEKIKFADGLFDGSPGVRYIILVSSQSKKPVKGMSRPYGVRLSVKADYQDIIEMVSGLLDEVLKWNGMGSKQSILMDIKKAMK